MADENPTGCAERDPCIPAKADRKVEWAVLSFLVDEHPDHQLTIPEVSRALNAGSEDQGYDDTVERAIRELVGAGLLHCERGFVLPTRAALYHHHLED